MSLHKRLPCVDCLSATDQHMPAINHEGEDKIEIAETDIVSVDAKKYKKASHKSVAQSWFAGLKQRLKKKVSKKYHNSQRVCEESVEYKPEPKRCNETLQSIADGSYFQEERGDMCFDNLSSDVCVIEHGAIVHTECRDMPVTHQLQSTDKPLLCLGTEKPEFIKSWPSEIGDTSPKRTVDLNTYKSHVEEHNSLLKHVDQSPPPYSCCDSKQSSEHPDLKLTVQFPRGGQVSEEFHIHPSLNKGYHIKHCVHPIPTAPVDESVNGNGVTEIQTPHGMFATLPSHQRNQSKLENSKKWSSHQECGIQQQAEMSQQKFESQIDTREVTQSSDVEALENDELQQMDISVTGKNTSLKDSKKLVKQQQAENLKQFDSKMCLHDGITTEEYQICDAGTFENEMLGQKGISETDDSSKTYPKHLCQSGEALQNPANDEIAEITNMEDQNARELTSEANEDKHGADGSKEDKVINIVPNALENQLISLKDVAILSPRKDALYIYVRSPTEKLVYEEIQKLMIKESIKYVIKKHNGTIKLNLYDSERYPFVGGCLASTEDVIGTVGGFVVDSEGLWYVLTNLHVLNAIMTKGSSVCTRTTNENKPLVINADTDGSFYGKIGNHVIADYECYFDIGMVSMSKELYPKKFDSLKQYLFCPHYLQDLSVPSIEIKSLSLNVHRNMQDLIGKTVYKYAQSTKKAKGRIEHVNTTYKTDGSSPKIYKKCIIIRNSSLDRPISDYGDSGAIYITEDGAAVAMHFATVTDYEVDNKEETVAVAFPLYLGLLLLQTHIKKTLKLVTRGNSNFVRNSIESGYAATEVPELSTRVRSLTL